MAKVNIISGFLGAGKTTLIKKLLEGAFEGEKVVLLENEYGEVGIDGGFMKDTGIQITELNSGCICCTLVGDFTQALGDLIDTYHPDRIIIEPSGVGKLSDIRRVVDDVAKTHDVQLAGCATVADVGKCRMYAHNFGEFFIDQIESAETIILSRTQTTSQDRIEKCVALLREHNAKARIITTPWDELDSKKMLETIEHPTFLLTVDDLPEADHHDHEHHHDHDHDHDHEHHHDHDHDHDHEHHHDHDHDHDHDAAVAVGMTITAITTPTRCSTISASRRPSTLTRRRFARRWRPWTTATALNTATYCAPRAYCPRTTAVGCISTMCPANTTCATARRITPAACA